MIVGWAGIPGTVAGTTSAEAGEAGPVPIPFVAVTVHVYEGGTTFLEDGRSLFSSERLDMSAFHDEPARAILENDVVYRWREHTFLTEIRATGRTTSDASSFFYDLRLEVDLDGERFFERAWHEVVPRQLV